ncbi:MAG TPA: glycosyltransferase family 2 protein [Gemmatimonadaceae bacterium]|jgi:glycosyltransferase involved in cell wall biosynthesis|nr:glycosyltransferase family 2 protein [Gemmatimonadaceae bacterium]
MPPAAHPDLSIVVPLYNEEESVGPLVDAVRDALTDHESWELVLVDDGSRDSTAQVAGAIAAADARVVLLQLARNYGQTQAMQAGFDRADGRIVVSMDGDLQNDPRDIPLLVAKLEEGYDLVAGYRMRRQDKFVTRKIPSWVANRMIIWLTGVRIRDNGCSLKAYRRDLLDQLHLYSDMHRFLPALAAATANARIAEVPVRHHARRFGVSKYGLSRILKLLADLLTIKMIASFRESPLAMFGLGALLAFAFALAFLGAWIWSFAGRADVLDVAPMNAYVFPGSALLCVALAAFLTMLGLIAEEALQKVRAEEQRDRFGGHEVLA